MKYQVPDHKAATAQPNVHVPDTSSASVHSLQPYSDNEPAIDAPDDNDNDYLPSYTDSEQQQLASGQPTPTASYEYYNYSIPSSKPITYSGKSYAVTLDPTLSTDPAKLENLLLTQAKNPPRPIIRVSGTHQRRSKDSNGKEKNETVTDFNFRIDGTSTLLWLGDGNSPMEPMMTDDSGEVARLSYPSGKLFRRLHVARPDERVYRGTRMAVEAPGKKAVVGGPEGAVMADEDASNASEELRKWCYLFCASSAGVRTFKFERHVKGLNVRTLQYEIGAVIRTTGYRGQIQVNVEVEKAGFVVRSPHWINKARGNMFVWWTMVILQLWILSWPVIWLLEKKWTPVRADWYTSVEYDQGATKVKRYATGLDEAGWVSRWRKGIMKGAIGRRMDFVTAHDLVDQPAEQTDEPSNGAVRGMLSFARGAATIHRDYQRSGGWGGDE